MGVSYVKFCPRCQTTTAVETAVCGKCGHQFRTHFQPPVSEQTVALTSADLAPHQLDRFASGTSDTAAASGTRRRRLRRPPRVIMLAAVIVALFALYGIVKVSRGRDTLLPPHPKAVMPTASAMAVVREQSSGQPAVLATRSPDDLQRWQEASTPSDNSSEGSDSPARVHLYLTGRVLLLVPGTQLRILHAHGDWCQVEILDGEHRGQTGYVPKQATS